MWWPLEVTLTAENLLRICWISWSVVGESILMWGWFTRTLYRSGTSRLNHSLLKRREKQCFSVWKYSDLMENIVWSNCNYSSKLPSLWLSCSLLADSCRWCSWYHSSLKARCLTANYYSLPGQIQSPSSWCCDNSSSSSWPGSSHKALANNQDLWLTSLDPRIDLGRLFIIFSWLFSYNEIIFTSVVSSRAPNIYMTRHVGLEQVQHIHSDQQCLPRRLQSSSSYIWSP